MTPRAQPLPCAGKGGTVIEVSSGRGWLRRGAAVRRADPAAGVAIDEVRDLAYSEIEPAKGPDAIDKEFMATRGRPTHMPVVRSRGTAGSVQAALDSECLQNHLPRRRCFTVGPGIGFHQIESACGEGMVRARFGGIHLAARMRPLDAIRELIACGQALRSGTRRHRRSLPGGAVQLRSRQQCECANRIPCLGARVGARQSW
jgi:hypothetical protein